MDARKKRAKIRSAGRLAAGIIMLLLPVSVCRSAGSGTDATFETLVNQAEQRAKHPYVPPPDNLPQSLKKLDYDQYRAIRYRRKSALWAGEGLPFEVEFYHRDYLFPRRVRMFVLNNGTAAEVPFSYKMFDYSGSTIEPLRLPEDLGFAGFRLLYDWPGKDYNSEFVSFLGASYFRAIGAGEVYGASARGLSVGMGEPNEEFPYFDAFWIEKPSADAKTITVYASLDSPSLTGAYRFDISPGIDTIIEVQAEIFARTTLARVGIAPLTSMYYYGLNAPKGVRNYRPQVHDSDGLLIDNDSAEWIWRPLWNPQTPSLSTFEVESVNGFGLMQRFRDPCDYKDSFAMYEKRPSIWVEPLEPWQGRGVRLLELPSRGEGQDNIGACWQSPEKAGASKSLSMKYRLYFGSSSPEPAELGKVVNTRWSGSPGEGAWFTINFGAGKVRPNMQPTPELVVSATGGNISGKDIRADWSDKYWRVKFKADPQMRQVMDIRVFLRRGGQKLTEVWSFAWPG
jgi:glucans biosynthesis protein